MSREMKWVQLIENACSRTIAGFAAVGDQGVAEGENAIDGFASLRFHFVSFRLPFASLRLVSPSAAAAARAPPAAASRDRFIFLKPLALAAP
jgi:hypothetical protein